MKLRRFLSGFFFGAGCALIFISLLALLMSALPNQQLGLILDSFSQASQQPLVSLMNRAMRFVLQQSWQVLALGVLTAAAGAALMLHFTPGSAVKKPDAPAASAPRETFETPVPEKANPFAAGTYNDHQPTQQHKNRYLLNVYGKPILEKNHTEESEVPAKETSPYIPARFAQETQAVEAELGAPSQSGSRILIRSTPLPPANHGPLPAKTPTPEAPKEAPPSAPPPAASSPSVPAPLPPFSPRIRSTIGRRSSMNKSNFPADRS